MQYRKTKIKIINKHCPGALHEKEKKAIRSLGSPGALEKKENNDIKLIFFSVY